MQINLSIWGVYSDLRISCLFITSRIHNSQDLGFVLNILNQKSRNSYQLQQWSNLSPHFPEEWRKPKQIAHCFAFLPFWGHEFHNQASFLQKSCFCVYFPLDTFANHCMFPVTEYSKNAEYKFPDNLLSWVLFNLFLNYSTSC